MPTQYIKVRDGKLSTKAMELVKEQVVDRIEDYNYATKYNYIIGDIFLG
jgi:tagatose-1,6-bisphosphate aldolase non-catalytic subunit AgaZ/GatZ